MKNACKVQSLCRRTPYFWQMRPSYGWNRIGRDGSKIIRHFWRRGHRSFESDRSRNWYR